MQDIHDYSMTGGGGGGGGDGGGRFYGGGERRMRAHQNNILNHHPSLNCPRCNSLNTKFCYYNNYNLSQPRHFCKNCRRYWTKGGVLRNVPVGGGCRKAKRSKSKQEQPPDVEEKSSSSESSSLTAATTAVTAAVNVTDVPNVKLYGNGIEWSTLLGQGSSDGGVFSEVGGFTSETTPFGYGGSSVNHLKLESDTVYVHQEFEDRTALVDPSIVYEPLDWESGGGDQTLFDHVYWSQSHLDQDGLYLP